MCLVKTEMLELKDPPAPRELMEIQAPRGPLVYQDQPDPLEIQ